MTKYCPALKRQIKKGIFVKIDKGIGATMIGTVKIKGKTHGFVHSDEFKHCPYCGEKLK